MAVFQQNPTQHDNCNPQSPEPSKPSPTSPTPMKLSTIDGWETPHTTMEDNFFYSEDEPRRVRWTSPLCETLHSEGEPRRIHLLPSPSPPSPPREMKRKSEMEMSFSNRGEVSQHVCEACGKMIPPTKDILGPSTKD